MILTIALKNLRLMLQNVAIVPLLIGMPVFQILLIKEVMDQSIPVVRQTINSSIMEVVFLQQRAETSMAQNFAASLLVMFILIAGIMAATFLIDEKEQKTMLRVFSTPIRRIEYITGNLLGHSIFMMCIALSIISITKYGIKIDWGTSWTMLSLVTLLVMFVAISFGYCFAGIFNKSKLANGVMSFVIVAMTFLSGGLSFNGSFRGFSNFTINKWGFEAYIALMRGEAFAEIKFNILILFLLGCSFTIISALLYRRENIYE